MGDKIARIVPIDGIIFAKIAECRSLARTSRSGTDCFPDQLHVDMVTFILSLRNVLCSYVFLPCMTDLFDESHDVFGKTVTFPDAPVVRIVNDSSNVIQIEKY